MTNNLNGIAYNGAASTTINQAGATIDNDNFGAWLNECNGIFNDFGTFLGTLIQIPC